MLRRFGLLLVAVAACRSARQGDLEERSVDELIEMLAADEFDVREAAEEELVVRGRGIRIKLFHALRRVEDPEAQARLVRVLGALGIAFTGDDVRARLQTLFDLSRRLAKLAEVIVGRTSPAWRSVLDREVEAVVEVLRRELSSARTDAEREIYEEMLAAVATFFERIRMAFAGPGGLAVLAPGGYLAPLDDLVDAFRRIIVLHGDLDEDGLPADWELEHGLDPTRDDSTEDPDRDGRTNREEFDLGSNPRRFTPRTD